MTTERDVLLAQAQQAKNQYQMMMTVAAERRAEAGLAKREAEKALALHLEMMDKIAALDGKN